METNDEEAKLLPNPNQKPKGWGTRHTLACMSFFGFGFSYAMRFNLSMAIVAMVNRTVPIVPNGTHVVLVHNHHIMDYESACPPENVQVITEPNFSSNWSLHDAIYMDDESGFMDEPAGEFNWDEKEQGLILGSFFYGYVITQLPGGVLAGKYGGKWPLGIGLFVTGIFALLTPIAARTHTGLLVAARIIQGLGEGLTTPAMHALLAVWAPPEERGRMASIAYAGTSFGTAATMVISGYLIHANVWGGWPSVFYVIGGASLVWFVLWCVLVYDTPEKHPRISTEELLHIQSAIGGQVSKTKLATPWSKIARSVPLWAILIAHTGHTWGLYTLLTELPTYMKLVLNFDMKQNSWMSALPYLVMWISAILLVRAADFFVAKRWMKTIHVRKLCQIIAHIGAGIALVAASYSGCDRILTVALLTIAVGLNGASFGGFGVNHVDIAANHAGVLMGITNTIANMSGFVAPYVAGLLINRHPTLERWQIVFFIAAGIYLLDTVIYLIFASATEQTWNRETEIEPPPVVEPSSSEPAINHLPGDDAPTIAAIFSGDNPDEQNPDASSS